MTGLEACFDNIKKYLLQVLIKRVHFSLIQYCARSRSCSICRNCVQIFFSQLL